MSAIKANQWLNPDGTENYKCRAWVNFDGTGTVAIRASGNVSSITDTSTGSYVMNFASPMPDANFMLAVSSNTAGGSQLAGSLGSFSVSGCSLYNVYPGVGPADASIMTAAIFR